MPLNIIENLNLEKPSFGPSKWLRKLKPAKNSKLSKLSESCFEPVGKGGWPSISTWIINSTRKGTTNQSYLCYHTSEETCSSGFVLKVLTTLDTSSPLHFDRTRDSTHIPLCRTHMEGHTPFLFTVVGSLQGSMSNKHPCIYSPCLDILTIQVSMPTLIQPMGVAISFRLHGGTYPQHFLETVTFLTRPTCYFTHLTTLGYTCCYSTSDLSQRL
jgi:hypothetical protein